MTIQKKNNLCNPWLNKSSPQITQIEPRMDNAATP